MTGTDLFFDEIITVKLSEDRESVDILDQTLLPNIIKRIKLRTREELWDAIKKLKVRGAPAIGVSAAYGLAVLANKIDADGFDGFYREFADIKGYLASSRPTAVNLFWALNRMDERVLALRGKNIGDIKDAPTPYSVDDEGVGLNSKWKNHDVLTSKFGSFYYRGNRRRGWHQPSFTINATADFAPLHPSSPKMVFHGHEIGRASCRERV